MQPCTRGTADRCAANGVVAAIANGRPAGICDDPRMGSGQAAVVACDDATAAIFECDEAGSWGCSWADSALARGPTRRPRGGRHCPLAGPPGGGAPSDAAGRLAPPRYPRPKPECPLLPVVS